MRILAAFLLCLSLAACGDPMDKPLTVETLTELNENDVLTEEQKTDLAAYIMRSSFATAMAATRAGEEVDETALDQPNVTVGEALERQRQFREEEEARVAAERERARSRARGSRGRTRTPARHRARHRRLQEQAGSQVQHVFQIRVSLRERVSTRTSPDSKGCSSSTTCSAMASEPDHQARRTYCRRWTHHLHRLLRHQRVHQRQRQAAEHAAGRDRRLSGSPR